MSTITATDTDTPANFLTLPSELRNKIYEVVLLHQEPVSFWVNNPWVKYNRRQKHTPRLFRANKTVHREAITLFYAQNCFDFTSRSAEYIISFLKQIGRNNANCIRHTYIDFPKFLYLDPTDITLEDDSVSFLENIQSSCANLSTITTSLWSTDAMERRLDNLEHSKIVTEALKLVDTSFRAISSLQEITVEVYEDGPSDYIRKRMKNHGWTIDATPEVEDGDGDFDYDEYLYSDNEWL